MILLDRPTYRRPGVSLWMTWSKLSIDLEQLTVWLEVKKCRSHHLFYRLDNLLTPLRCFDPWSCRTTVTEPTLPIHISRTTRPNIFKAEPLSTEPLWPKPSTPNHYGRFHLHRTTRVDTIYTTTRADAIYIEPLGPIPSWPEWPDRSTYDSDPIRPITSLPIHIWSCPNTEPCKQAEPYVYAEPLNLYWSFIFSILSWFKFHLGLAIAFATVAL